MQVLLDTNILLDFFLKRKQWYKNSLAIWRANRRNVFEGFMLASSVTDIAYFLEDEISRKAAKRAVTVCLQSVSILPVNRERLTEAVALNGTDFEDDLQIACALHFGLDGIVTRDKRGFLNSPISVWTPTQFIKELQRQRTKNNE